jgi:hypothetical protein
VPQNAALVSGKGSKKSMMDSQIYPPVKTGLVIQLLGGFSISNDQETIGSMRWKSRRAG